MNSIIIFCAQYLFIAVLIGLVVAWLQLAKDKKVNFFLATIVAGVIAFVISRIASKIYYDPRPFVTEHVKPLIKHAADNGFPSDHALLTGTLTAITYFYNKKVSYIMFLLTFIIGLSRVLAKVHSPLDIIGGWVFGVVGAICGYLLIEWASKKYLAKYISEK
ncbi:MAG TPA: phosphatase PAP2 family protein [Candidatus Saccharimonadales bacterium]|nr:phosphatase PAP2 family protein [Candidatus Saccharimonadales bacterium]